VNVVFSDTPRPGRGKRIVIRTVGSLGDLHPYLAVALGLQARGHDAVLATSECYRHKITALGLGFHPVRPDSDWVTDPRVMRRIMDPRMGTVWCVREMILSVLRESYEDTLAASKGADLLVSHMPWDTRLVAEKTGIPWASTMITPLGFFSAHDVPVFPLAPFLSKTFRRLGPRVWGPFFRLGKWLTRPWARPFYQARAELGLPPAPDLNPLSDSHSPSLVLALFSKLLADNQPDWPRQTVLTGFPIYDRHGATGLPPALTHFLDDGPAPIVFTLGWSAANVGGRFFEHSIAAAKLLGRRAILIVGHNPHNRPTSVPPGAIVSDYAPFSELFPRAAAVVHPGGIGTTGLAMRSGRPSLVVPFAHDQPDNAARAVRLGIARTISPRRYTAARAAAELRQLLDDPEYSQRASVIGEQVRREDGVRAACDALEKL
jgi:UDP:flavonoid glycosyltransferase YjiC (YdhE family)